MINREIDRIQLNKSSNNRIKRTFTDDSYVAFSFFMALFAQVFSPSKTLFSNEFVELIEEVNNKKVTYGKKHDVCCDGSVKITISYLTNRLDRLTYDEDEKRVFMILFMIIMFMIQLLIVLGLTFYQIPMVITQKVEEKFYLRKA